MKNSIFLKYNNSYSSDDDFPDTFDEFEDEMNRSGENIINIIEIFLNKVNIKQKLNGICAVTIAEDRGSICGTFIFSYLPKLILKQYPGRINSNSPIYKSLNGINYTININTNLKYINANGKYNKKIKEDKKKFPFCCNCSLLY